MVDAGRSFIAGLTADLKESGLHARYPIIIWRDREGFMKACACSDSRSWVFIRDDVGAPDRIAAPDGDTADESGPPPAGSGDGSAEALPYPALPPIAPATGTPARPVVPAPRPEPASPPAPRKAPEATRNDETTFF